MYTHTKKRNRITYSLRIYYATSTVTFAFVSAWLYAGHSCVLPQDVKSIPATAREATKMITFFIFCSSNFRDAKLAICFYVGYLFDVKKYYRHLPFALCSCFYVFSAIRLRLLRVCVAVVRKDAWI